MIRLERLRPELDVVDDQHGQPTWTADVAGQIIALIQREAAPGVYHATSSGQTTWCGLAREIFRLLGADPARVGQSPAARRADRPRAGPAAGLQRPGPRRMEQSGHRAHRRLAAGTGPGVSPLAAAGTAGAGPAGASAAPAPRDLTGSARQPGGSPA
jgi:dTDP-4-dehydrorhamnose reductase